MDNGLSVITIVIPTRKGEDAKITIDSLNNQTFKDFTVVLVVDEFGKGAPWTRNEGFKQVKTEFVLFADDDIQFKSKALETMLKVLKANPQASYCYGRYKLIAENGDAEIFSHEAWNPHLLRRKNYISTMSLIRTKDLPNPPFDENIKRFQDWDLWLTMLEQGKRGIYCEDLIFETKIKDGISFNNPVNFLDGMEIIKAKHMSNPYQLEGSLKGKKVIDIGANRGEFAMKAAELGANVLAFEPNTESFNDLKRNVNGKNITCRQEAVGNPGVRSLYGSGTGASLFQELFNKEFTESVKVVSLKEIIGDEIIDLIKLNCEGAEYEIIPEIEKYKNQIREVIIEFHKDRIDPKGYDVYKQLNQGVFHYKRIE